MFWIGYLVLGVLATLVVVALTRPIAGHWARHAAVCLVLAVLIAPSFVARGHGIGPAWMSAVDARSFRELCLYGLAPVAATWSVLFLSIRALVSRFRGRQKTQQTLYEAATNNNNKKELLT